MPARQQPVRRKSRRVSPSRPVQSRPAARPEQETTPAVDATSPQQPQTASARPAGTGIAAARAAAIARANENARLDVIYMGHDLRNVGYIAGLMLVLIIVLTVVLH
jgi:hypothetical protein